MTTEQMLRNLQLMAQKMASPPPAKPTAKK
jgi:hypothetical protein